VFSCLGGLLDKVERDSLVGMMDRGLAELDRRISNLEFSAIKRGESIESIRKRISEDQEKIYRQWLHGIEHEVEKITSADPVARKVLDSPTLQRTNQKFGITDEMVERGAIAHFGNPAGEVNWKTVPESSREWHRIYARKVLEAALNG
jgi:hypothetical protein